MSFWVVLTRALLLEFRKRKRRITVFHALCKLEEGGLNFVKAIGRSFSSTCPDLWHVVVGDFS
jgi:hypothetical protein